MGDYLRRHARLYAGHPRLAFKKKDVDGRGTGVLERRSSNGHARP